MYIQSNTSQSPEASVKGRFGGFNPLQLIGKYEMHRYNLRFSLDMKLTDKNYNTNNIPTLYTNYIIYNIGIELRSLVEKLIFDNCFIKLH